MEPIMVKKMKAKIKVIWDILVQKYMKIQSDIILEMVNKKPVRQNM